MDKTIPYFNKKYERTILFFMPKLSSRNAQDLGSVKTDNFLGIVKKIGIRKKSGKIRVIYIPKKSARIKLKEILESDLNKKYNIPNAHGFVKGRNIVTNAKPHIPFRYTLNIDLKDFFDTVTLDKLNGKVPDTILGTCLIDGIARQGLNTSPFLANIAAGPMDVAIEKLCKKMFIKFAYTRYADDLSISYNEEIDRKEFLLKINEIVRRCGFFINEDKIHFQDEKGGRRIICGISVSSITKDIRVPRVIKRKLRAAKHRLEKIGTTHQRQIVRGLEEFSALKIPNTIISNNQIIRKNAFEAKIIEKKFFKENKWFDDVNNIILARKNKLIKEEIITGSKGEELIISTDPVYFMGLSAYTTNWTSCNDIRKRDNSRRAKDLPVLALHPGTAIAMLIDKDKYVCIKGIKRHPMTSRAVLYKAENNQIYFGRIYGNDIDFTKLLKDFGFDPVTPTMPNDLMVEGSISVKSTLTIYGPAIDGLKITSGKIIDHSKSIYLDKKERML